MKSTKQLATIAAFCLGLAVATGADAATITVINASDNAVSPQVGSLRAALLASASGDAITFACGAPCTIMLAAALPPITQNLTIDGGTLGNVVIDGAGQFPGFFVDTGTVTLAHLRIQNATAHGGNGGASGGGGGLGAGGGLFVNKPGAVVTVNTVFFQNCSAVGGTGDPGALGAGGGGGGGLFFAGGNWDIAPGGASGSAGGGGVLGAGATPNVNDGGNGGAGGGGGGSGLAGGGTGGTGFATDPGGSNGSSSGLVPTGVAGGAGGFGGGGGGGEADHLAGAGGAGGFGGGGGGGGIGDDNGALGGTGGAGGPGGGGGGGGDSEAGTNGVGGLGGVLATLRGGNGGNALGNNGGAGGGGAAAGPAIFVNQGSVTILESGASGLVATAGTGANNGTADPAPVFNYAGLVNGSGAAGPVARVLFDGPPPPVPSLGFWALIMFAGGLAAAGLRRAVRAPRERL
jgi:hypothetical protein